MCPSTRDVFSGPCPFTVFIVDVTAMFIVLAFIYVLQLMRGILNLCDELNIWFQLMRVVFTAVNFDLTVVALGKFGSEIFP